MPTIQHISSHPKGTSHVSKRPLLTRRQNECLRLVAMGFSERGIAFRLGITERMVRTHLSKARDRLEAHSIAEAVYNAIKQDVLK